jgi:transcriptional regulator with XRE-family HTH domain
MQFDLAALRKSSGRTQADVAALVDLPRHRIGRLEAGVGSLETLAAVVKALDGVMPCLRSIRLRCNVSSRELARRIGTTHSVISVMEHERRGSISTWQSALAALGVTIDLSPPEPPWSTPAHITSAILQAFGAEKFCLDPASPEPPTVSCASYYTSQADGLAHRWHGRLVWLNPPYGPGELQKWIDKAVDEYEVGHARKIVLLLPARLETAGMRRLRAGRYRDASPQSTIEVRRSRRCGSVGKCRLHARRDR